MKRFLSMLMTLVLLCGCFAMAEVKTFDYKVLEGLDGYSYDKFEKMWSLAGEYRIKAADGYISVALIALGDKESVQGVMLTAGVYKSDGSIYGTIDKIEILADDTLISIKMMPLEGQQARLLTDTSAEAPRLISEAKEISFKIALKNAGSGTFDPTADEIADFVQAAKAIIENNMLSLSTNAGIDSEAIEKFEETYPITIEK